MELKPDQIERLNQSFINWHVNYSVYPYNAYTINELVMQLQKAINDSVLLSEETKNLAIALYDWVKGEGLQDSVMKELEIMYNDGTLGALINDILLSDINNKVDNFNNTLNNKIDNTIIDFNNIVRNTDKDLKFITNSSNNGFINYDNKYIYSWDKLSLLHGIYSYYDSNYYPSVCMNKEGIIKLRGIAKATLQPHSDSSGLLIVAKILNFNIIDNVGVPMFSQVTLTKDNDTNSSQTVPCMLKTDGTICIKNIGFSDNWFNKISFFQTSFNTQDFGEDVINSNIDNVIKKVIEKSKISSCNFVFFTDLHNEIYKENNKFTTIKAINRIDRTLQLNSILSGGDNIVEPFNTDLNVSINEVISLHRQVCSSFRSNLYMFANGNHDNNATQNYPDNENYTVFPQHIKPYFNNSKFVFGGINKYYGYMDNEESKTRFIIIDSYESDFKKPFSSPANVTNNQIKWHLENSLNMKNKENYKVVFCSHLPPIDMPESEGNLTNKKTIRNILNAFKNGTDVEFDNKLYKLSEQGKQIIICYLYGHTHNDEIKQVDNINFVSTRNAWCIDSNGVKRYYGTEKELSFDIVQICDFERKVYFYRVGAFDPKNGNIRFVTY